MLDFEEGKQIPNTINNIYVIFIFLHFSVTLNYDKTDLFALTATAPNLSQQKTPGNILRLGHNQDDGYVYNHASIEMHLLGYTVKRKVFKNSNSPFHYIHILTF